MALYQFSIVDERGKPGRLEYREYDDDDAAQSYARELLRYSTCVTTMQGNRFVGELDHGYAPLTSPPDVDPAVVADLCVDLRVILEAEVAAGNLVSETSRSWPFSVNLWLDGPFRTTPRKLPEHVSFRTVGDPHYWPAEYQCTKHQHFLADRHR